MMKKKLLFVLCGLLVFSILFNIYSVFQMNNLKNEETLYSYDRSFYSIVSSNKYSYNIQIAKDDDSGRYIYCDPTIYSRWFKIDLLWSKESYDLYIFSHDIGLRCIHMDSSGIWDVYRVSYDGENVFLNSTESKELDSARISKIILKKDSIPEKVLDYLTEANARLNQ